MTGALFILQISKVLSQHFLGLITNPEIRPVIRCADHMIRARLDMKEQEFVRVSIVIDDVDEFLPVSRHRPAAFFWCIDKFVNLIFSAGINTLQNTFVVTYPYDKRSAVSICKC